VSNTNKLPTYILSVNQPINQRDFIIAPHVASDTEAHGDIRL